MNGFFNGLAAAVILLGAAGASAQTNTPADAETKGRILVQKIQAQLEQEPAEGLTNTGVLQIRDDQGHSHRVPLVFKLVVGATNWQIIYEATTPEGIEKLTINRGPNHFQEILHETPGTPGTDSVLDRSFAHSDFLVGDLALQFFGWPKQTVLRWEMHRSCGCTVLESTNPEAGPYVYSRVVSWIDDESLGIVEAEAYDARGKLLKDFEPKDLKKVNGQYQVQSMVMENAQTAARTRMVFDLKKPPTGQ